MAAPSTLTITKGEAGLRIIGLRKSYRKRLVIRDVNLELSRGEVVALLGPNGSGKTTCFYAIAGLVMPEGGQVLLDGRDVLEALLDELHISHIRNSPGQSLSGGERRRVEIARCLAADPKYLLLDEPFAGVDPIAVAEIRSLVADLKTRGIGVLITDHNVRETLEIVDRAYILHDGKVLMSGTTEEVIRDENVRRVYLGQSFRIN